MNIILLSGGSGKRLWPLSNDVRSKQFIKLFPDDNGNKESLIQRICRQIRNVADNSNITIATVSSQVSLLRAQVPGADICIEPERKDTFPAIALAAAFLHEKKNVDPSEPVIVCPADMYVDPSFFESVLSLGNKVSEDPDALCLMGIEPTYPSDKFGYIMPESEEQFTKVSSFREKPDVSLAEQYIAQGALWNCGVFAFSLDYIMRAAQNVLGFFGYEQLLERYGELTKISFDYAVVEKAEKINVLRFQGNWDDLGTWDSLVKRFDYATLGEVISDKCRNTFIVNETVSPIVALGIEDLVIAASPDGVLVTSLKAAGGLKDCLKDYDRRPMYEERQWGTYKVLFYDEQRNSLTKELILNPGKHISYQKHLFRDEIWTIVSGEGLVIQNDVERKVTRGDIVKVNRGEKHAIKALTELHIIEVQMGEKLTEEDIERFDCGW